MDQILDQIVTVPSSPYSMNINDGEGTTIYDSFTVIREFERYYYYQVWLFEYGTDQPYQVFHGQWARYLDQHGEDLIRAYTALYSTYDPITNYDMTEEALDGRKLDSNTETTTPTGKTTTTTKTEGKLKDTENVYKTGVGSGGSETLTDKIETISESGDAGDTNQRVITSDIQYEAGTKTERKDTPANTQSGVFGSDTRTGYHEATEHLLSRKGNIGVTTTQQMIESELDLRKQNLLQDFIRQFVDTHCYYVGGV